MVFKKSILSGFVILLLPILITGCVIAPIHYNWWEYEPVDSINIRKNDIEYVYIPRVRPPRFYSYNKFWYAEPYTILIFEDSNGYKTREKIPNSLLKKRLIRERPIMKRKKDVESIMRDINRMKDRKDRHNNRRRMRKRS